MRFIVFLFCSFKHFCPSCCVMLLLFGVMCRIIIVARTSTYGLTDHLMFQPSAAKHLVGVCVLRAVCWLGKCEGCIEQIEAGCVCWLCVLCRLCCMLCMYALSAMLVGSLLLTDCLVAASLVLPISATVIFRVKR